MKKVLIVVPLSLLMMTAASAQDIRLGVKGFFNSTWMFNNNISDAKEQIDYAATFGPSFGLTSMLYFSENLGISLDVLYSSNNQKLNGQLSSGSYESTIKIKYIDIPVLLRITSEGGAYAEIGPQVSLLSGAKEDFVSSPSSPQDYTERDVKKYFNSLGLDAVLGFGVDVQASDNLFINIGLRFGYGVTDATNKLSETELALYEAADASSWYGDAAHQDVLGKYNYHRSSRAFGGFSLGIIFKPGR